MTTVSSSDHLSSFEVFGEPWIRSILGNSASRSKSIIFIWAVFLLLPAFLFFVPSWMDGSLRIEDGLGLLDDRQAFAAALIVPAVLSGFAILSPGFSEVLHSLRWVIAWRDPAGTPNMNGDLLSEEEFQDMLARYEWSLLITGSARYLAVGMAALGLAIWGYVTVIHFFAPTNMEYGKDYWGSQNFMASFVVSTLFLFFLYVIALPYVFFKLMMVLQIMRRSCIELNDIKVLRIRPLNPDKAGGLGAFGSFAFKFILLFSVPAVLVVLYPIFIGYNGIFFIFTTVYIFSLILVFFYPLSGAHQAMSQAKRATLERMSGQINRIYDNLMVTVTPVENLALGPQFDVADRLDKLYSRAQEMPVWPFDLATFAKFATIIISVALTGGLKWFVDRLVGSG